MMSFYFNFVLLLLSSFAAVPTLSYDEDCDASLPRPLTIERLGRHNLAKFEQLFPGQNFDSCSSHNLNMTFEQWANLAEEGLGMMCRTNRDCDWLDSSLYCQNYKTSIRLRTPWFGQSPGSIVRGYCGCPVFLSWDEEEVKCGAFVDPGDHLYVFLVFLGIMALVLAVSFLCIYRAFS